jgi:hypothetical protein
MEFIFGGRLLTRDRLGIKLRYQSARKKKFIAACAGGIKLRLSGCQLDIIWGNQKIHYGSLNLQQSAFYMS